MTEALKFREEVVEPSIIKFSAYYIERGLDRVDRIVLLVFKQSLKDTKSVVKSHFEKEI